MNATGEVPIQKPSISAVVLALLMLFFGFLMSGFGFVALRDWQSERTALITCGVLWILTGPAVFASALWLLGSLGRSRPALRLGGIAIALPGSVLATAAAVHVLQCSGPA